MAFVLSSPHQFGVFKSDKGSWKLPLIIVAYICKPVELSTVAVIFPRLLLGKSCWRAATQSCLYMPPELLLHPFLLEVNLGWVLNPWPVNRIQGVSWLCGEFIVGGYPIYTRALLVHAHVLFWEERSQASSALPKWAPKD